MTLNEQLAIVNDNMGDFNPLEDFLGDTIPPEDDSGENEHWNVMITNLSMVAQGAIVVRDERQL